MWLLDRLRADLGTGKNLEIYLTALIALTVGVLGVFDVVNTKVVGAATLATLALVAVNTLGPKQQVAELTRLVESKLAGDGFLSTEKDLKPRIAHANDIRFVGVTLSRTIRAYVDDLQKGLNRGARVRVLVIDPTGTVPEEAARRSTIPDQPDVFEHRVRYTLYVLRDMEGEERLEVRLLPFLPAFGMLMLDPGDDDGVIHVELGTHRSPGRDPGFTLDGARDHHWCRHFTAEFDRLWEAAREVTEADWYPAQRST
ncbi:hypothetical protein SAMN05444920_101299 [Nonomuraea solani]|uniref:Uncharacterized protein n=1 Tax=Nonomuraea solani TaxID=1144553 RepID=A0A1H5TS64_9ACTN|nr:hypothetical protein [Nonomuraea solani]SEF65609.1 hypothetical protein SAMN05444920_101299 [Nonomuraea solani]